jgi:surface protein
MTHSNAPLNFRHTDTLITTKVPHYPTKVTTGMSIIPGWNRPNANGQNANINDKDYNGPDFKARPLKHWRKQLRVYDYKGAANNSRTASISELERPGTTVYHFTPDCACVPGEGGNSYIISNNKFGYETKNDDYSKDVIDVKIQNNGYIVVPYDATEQQINDPTNPAYKILTGIYNTDCINCSPQGNLIRSGIGLQSQAYYSYSNDKLESRCQTFEQNMSTNKATGGVYFDAQGIPLWPNDAPNGPQVVAPVNYGSTIYKGNFFNLYEYIYNGVAAGSASNVNSALFTPKVKCNPKYVVAGFYVNYAPAALIEAAIYNSSNVVICKSINTQNSYINTNPPYAPSFNLAARLFHFPETIFLEPSNSYYINFKTMNSINFNWLVYNSVTTLILAGVLVAEPLYCPSQTIYKPNNIAFAKQGAVSGSARLKKLVSDTVTMNGSSFYSARGAEEANLGRYQGTNISGNYYLKNKPVTNSCLGTIPTAPIVFITENDTYSITFSWREIGNSFCGVEYYTVTYYAIDIIERIRNIEDIVYIDDMKYTQDVQETLDIHDTQEFLNINEAVSQTGQHIFSKNTIINDDTIYTDSENNIKFKVASEIKNIIVAPDPTKIITTHIISSLNSETNYFVSMTSTNGNGTSIRSNNVLTNTLFDSNIKIMIDASSNTFRYNSSNPVTLTVTLSSLHSDTPISLAIIESSRKEVAEITKVTGTANTYKVSLNNTGTFKFNAKQERDSNKVTIYGTSVARSLIITVNKDTPLFSTSWNAFPTLNTSSTIYIGSVLTITAPSILSPSSVFTEILPIRYTFTSNDDGIITITHDDISTQAYITVNKIGKFQIIGNTIESDRFETTKITSEIEYNTDRSSPLIAFPNFDKEITFGQQPYTLVPVSFTRPTNPAAAGISVTYTSTDPTVASISGTTVRIHKSGTFKITALTNQTDAFKSVSLTSDTITVNKATPTFASSWNAFTSLNTSYPISVGSALTITAPSIASPSPIPNEILPIRYESNPGDAITIVGTAVTLGKAGQFNLIARTKGSDNYYSVSVNASPITVVNITIVLQSGTIVWVGEPTITTSPRFVQANPRGTGTEWFAVVDNRSLSEITSYARTNNSSHFTPQGETKPVIFNNIVTTLMTNMSGMFSGASIFNQPISSWDTVNVTNMSGMFSGASSFNQQIGSWNTANVTTMQGMFQNASAFNQAIDSWNTTKVTTMQGMFQNASAFNQPISAWKTNSVIDMGDMFRDAITFNQPLYIANVHTTLTIRLGGTEWQTRIINNDTSQTNIQYWNPDSQWFETNTAPLNEVALQFRFFAAYVTTFYGVTSASATVFSGSGNLGVYSFTRISETQYSATFVGGFVDGVNRSWEYTLPIDISTNRTIGSWNTGNVINMSNMFNNAREFDKLIITFNTANVTTMQGMFANAIKFNQPIGSWNTSSVTNMESMFMNAVKFSQSLNNWNTSKVTNMSGMFQNASTFNQPIDSWNISNVTNISNMFNSAWEFDQPISAFNTAIVTNMRGMFANAFKFNQAIGSWNTTNVTTMQDMFMNAIKFNKPIGSWNTAKVTTMQGMFQNASAFNQNISSWWVYGLNSHPNKPADFDTNATALLAIPYYLPNWALVPISLAANGVTIQYTGLASYVPSSTPLFIQMNPRGIGLEWFAVVNNTSKPQIKNYASNGTSSSYFTTSGQLVPFNNIVTTLMTDMSDMFYDVNGFNQDIGSWDTSNVTDMYGMFMRATTFNQNIGSWNTAKVRNMFGMFNYASTFNRAIGGWNTSRVNTMERMFDNAISFNQYIGGWDTGQVSNMSFMFSFAQVFNQNISMWDTQFLQNFSYFRQRSPLSNANTPLRILQEL